MYYCVYILGSTEAFSLIVYLAVATEIVCALKRGSQTATSLRGFLDSQHGVCVCMRDSLILKVCLL